MVSVPVRVAPGLASKVNVARPLPLPLALVCSHDALAVGVQAPPVTTMEESLPAAGPSRSDDVPMPSAALTVTVAVALSTKAAPALPLAESLTRTQYSVERSQVAEAEVGEQGGASSLHRLTCEK